MLSRLISLLRRIPAVKWAFTRLAPPPQSGVTSVTPSDVTAIAADNSPATTVEPTPVPDHNISPSHEGADVAVTAPVAERDAAVSVIAKSPTAAPSEIDASADLPEQPSAEVQTVSVEEASVASVDVESAPVEATDLVVSNAMSAEVPSEVAPAGAEQVFVSPADVEVAQLEVSDLVMENDSSADVSAEIEQIAAVDEAPPAVVEAEVMAAEVSEVAVDADPAPSVAGEIAPLPAPVSPVVEIRNAVNARQKTAEPVDRATLIRRRWAETGIRMWNPRLHGTGEATLNIQGSVELLPPAPGETMPRYDKLEFRMLGGQIVCEGVIVEAPAQVDKRSFTRLAEPGKPERVRETVRERQAALA